MAHGLRAWHYCGVNGLPAQPWPALDAEQRGHAVVALQLYWTDHYRLGHAYAKPEYVMQEQAYRADDLPEGYSSQDAGRRGKGSFTDPTFRAAQTAIDGPPAVVLSMPYFAHIPHPGMAALLDALPTHLSEPVRYAYIRRQHYVGAGETLHLSYRTVGRRCQDALEAISAMLYRERWELATSTAAAAVA